MSSRREWTGAAPAALAGDPQADRPRRTLLAAAILLVFALAAFGDVLFVAGEKSDTVVSLAHNDLALQYAAWRDFGFSQLRHGNFPLWNPHIYSGAPFFGGLQSGLLYPLNFQYLFLPLARAINIGVALHVFLGGLFMYLWASRRRLRFLACLFCGVLWMFCGQHYHHVMAGHLTGLISTAWIPLLFLSLDGLFEDENASFITPHSALRTPKSKWILLGSLTVAMMALGGDPQYLFHAGVAAALYSLLCLATARNRARILTSLAAICIVGGAIAAVQLLSGVETTAESLRGGRGVTYEFAGIFWLPPENFLTFLAPGFFGPVTETEYFRYWGRCFLWEMCLFIGVTGLLLAIYGAVAGERAKRRYSLAMALVMLVLALGAWLPPVVTGVFPSLLCAVLLWKSWNAAADRTRLRLVIRASLVLLLAIVLALWWFTPLFHVRLFRLLYDWAPGFNRFRGMSKFAVPATAFLVLLSGVGLDKLLRAERINTRLAAAPLLLAALLIGLGAGLALSVGQTQPAPWWWRTLHVVRDTPQIHVTPALYDDTAFVQQAQIHSGKSLLWAAIPCAIAGICLLVLKSPRKIGLCLAILGMGEMLIFAWSLETTFDLQKTAFALKDFFESHPGDFRVLQPAQGNFVMAAGGYDVWGYGPLVPARYGQFISFTQGINPDQAEPALAFRYHLPIYEIFRCRYSIFPAVKAQVHDILPHVALMRDYILLTKRGDIFDTLIDVRFDKESQVILESRPDPEPAPSARPGYAAVAESGTDYLVIEAETDAPALLLVTDGYSAGWRARPLGEKGPQSRYEILPANYCLRAVPLKAGHHKILMEYAPRGFRIGRWISIVAAAGWILAFGWMVARRPRRY